MRLLSSQTSPFSRAVRVAAHERGIRLEIEPASPYSKDTASLLAVNPLGRVPALVHGKRLVHDSRVIVRYLDAWGDEPELAGGFDDEVRVSMGHGLMEAGLLLRLELLRDPAEQSAAVVTRQRERILRTVGSVAPGGERFTLGDIYVACALEYIDFRHPGLGWQETNAGLKAFSERTATRESMEATAFASAKVLTE